MEGRLVNALDGKLKKAHFHTRNDKESCCFFCKHEETILDNPSDWDNSPREFYCNYFPFRFGRDVQALHKYVCDHFDDSFL